jgi:hypothetical protein
MSNRRHLPRPLFSLYKQLDRQRAVQRRIAFALLLRPRGARCL